ncbi:hypothetical protein [Paraclostridium bifermentans]|uniref:hypothetical protein n=1 Tax=Paraclostridium bifermentans TaxID=1490 RepID=UPI0025AF64BF|nr:hypothetical protein [Paraclostridium bifermentans]
MRVEKLNENMVIKNYKMLCEILEIPQLKTGSNSHHAQISELRRYIEYDKKGHKFVITKIFKEPKEKLDLRVNNKGGYYNVYKDDFRKLMLHMLHKDKSENKLVSKGSLYEAMNLVNPNYKLGKQDIEKLSKLIEIPINYISDFYNENNKKIRENTERNLRALRSESLIMFDIVTAIATTNITIPQNQLGTAMLDEHDNIMCNKRLEYRKATKEEKQVILQCESFAKKELGFKTDKEIFTNGAWNKYNQVVSQNLKETYTNIRFYYNAYEITWNNEKIEEEYNNLGNNETYENTSYNINYNIINSIKKSAEKRYRKSLKIDKANLKNYKMKKFEVQSNCNYIKQHNKIAHLLIDNKAHDLELKLKNIYLGQMEFDI